MSATCGVCGGHLRLMPSGNYYHRCKPEGFKTKERYRTYMRNYMRAYRAKERSERQRRKSAGRLGFA